MTFPVADLHCDLTGYLDGNATASARNTDDIGCALPWLNAGNVKLQVLAIYTATGAGSTLSGLRQAHIINRLPAQYPELVRPVQTIADLEDLALSQQTGIVAAIENASGFCGEDEPIAEGFDRLEQIINTTGRILYIGLTHHGENRFGGGNMTTAGLKEDGKTLLNYLNGRKITLDFAHTSDALAYDLLNHIDRYNLDIPVIASHSNFRAVWNHLRNLPDDIATELVKRGGLIGMNFLRAFLHNDNPNALYEHLAHGQQLGGAQALCLGADYFYTGHHPDQSRRPFYHKEHENAGCYPALMQELVQRTSAGFAENVSYNNVISFIRRVWA